MSTPNPPDAVKLLAKRILEIGYEDLPARERHVIERVARRIAVSRDVTSSFEENRSFGERLADRIAAFGGSWTFLMLLPGDCHLGRHQRDIAGQGRGRSV